MFTNLRKSPIIRTAFTGFLPFDLQDLDGFPYRQYTEQQEAYDILENWYNGEPLRAYTTDAETGKRVDKYPIKINPLKGTAQKHASTVIGQNVGSIRFSGMPFQIIPDVDLAQGEEAAKKQKDRISRAINKTFEENSLGAQFLSACIRSQYLGGSVFAAKFVPDEKRVEISTPSPSEFIGVPSGSDYWNLREAWIVREIDEFVARSYGYAPRPNENKFWYIEHWTKKDYDIMINGQTLTFENGIKQKGPNPFGRVPIVYVPHIRVNGFLGVGIVSETVQGVIKELNLRWADVGDAVNDDSHSFVAVRQIRGTINPITVDGRPVLDLGSSTGMAGDPQPDMFSVATKSVSEPMLKLGSELYKIYRRETNLPAVADGEDEGSQRSSLTLATRMAPLVAEADIERLFYTVGMTHFVKTILTIFAEKKLEEITKDDVDVSMITQWQNMLPRDREALTQEAAVRSKNRLGSNQHLMGLFGDVNNPEEEQRLIEEEQKAAQKFAVQPGFGNNGSNGNNGQAGATTVKKERG